MKNLILTLKSKLAASNFQCSLISVQHLSVLKSELEQRLGDGSLDRNFYHERLTAFSYTPPAEFPDAKSIIITAAPQPKIWVEFWLDGKNFSAVVPPTYSYATDEKVFQILSHRLADYGYRVEKAIVPEKMLAVRSGLAGYGRNNVTYVEPYGSFARLKSFWSDLPCNSDYWQEFQIMERCRNCLACIKKCPTKAICPERFMIRAERCLTFLNEKSDAFPDWVDPEWHNCLIGCMICQDICPLNKTMKDWVVKGEQFSELETLMILNGELKEKLSAEIQDKLKRLYLWDDYALLQRNFKVLIKKRNY